MAPRADFDLLGFGHAPIPLASSAGPPDGNMQSQMTAPYRTQALSALTDDDAAAMLKENETLFVEHKKNLRREGEAYNVAKAMSAFANTLGGWVLIGVTHGSPNAGQADGWDPVPSHALVDHVRQVLERHVDPIPPFAAAVLKAEGEPVGVIRVYDSTDTPHVTRPDGAIYVRSVAEDRRYHTLPLDSQATLFALAERGERAQLKARELLAPNRTPLMQAALNLESITPRDFFMRGASVVVRAVPLTHYGMAEWAVTEAARAVLEAVASRLARDPGERDAQFRPQASGLVFRQRTDGEQPLVDGLDPPRAWSVVAATDAAGVVGVGIFFRTPSPPRPKTTLSFDSLRDGVFMPLLTAAVDVLMAGEFFGRVHFELRLAGLDEVFDLNHQGATLPIPSHFPTGGDTSLPGATVAPEDGAPDLQRLGEQLIGDFAREAGFPCSVEPPRAVGPRHRRRMRSSPALTARPC
jgi:Putative DNA-binding domain